MLPFGFVVLATMIGIAWKRRSGLMQVGVTLLCFFGSIRATRCCDFLETITGLASRLRQDEFCMACERGKADVFPLAGRVNSRALHPTRKILSWPEVYEFATPVSGTYPVFYDPTYWWAGVDTRMHLAAEIACLKTDLIIIGLYFAGPAGILTAIVLLMFFLSDRFTIFGNS